MINNFKMNEGVLKMTEIKSKSTQKARKTTKKVEEVAVDPRQIDLIEGKTVAEIEAEAAKAKGAKRGRKGANDVVEVVADNRPVIAPELFDLTMSEVRDSVQRFKRGAKQHSFTLDLRNLQVLNQIADENGLDKSTVLDIAINRFVDVQPDVFPFQALKDIKADKRVTFVISDSVKNRLNIYAKKETRQSAQFIVNLALQSLRDQMRSERK